MRRLLLVLLIVLSLALVVGAQTFRGAINGAVTDPTGAFVPGATVTDKATNIVHSTITTSEGQFAFQDLPLGTYMVNVSAGGFSAITVDNVAVTAGSIYTLPIKLKIGKEAVSVEVSAAVVVLVELLALVVKQPQVGVEVGALHPDGDVGQRVLQRPAQTGLGQHPPQLPGHGVGRLLGHGLQSLEERVASPQRPRQQVQRVRQLCLEGLESLLA